MKHYIQPIKQSAGGQTTVYVPFDGVVTSVRESFSYANAGSQLRIISFVSPAYTVEFFHIYGITLKAGDVVKAGQLIGHHEVQAVNVGHANYDIAMHKFDTLAMLAQVRRLISMMDLLSPEIANLFAAAGLTRENSIWPRTYRDSNPYSLKSDGYFATAENPLDKVILKQ